jgi:hypothetical protein
VLEADQTFNHGLTRRHRAHREPAKHLRFSAYRAATASAGGLAKLGFLVSGIDIRPHQAFHSYGRDAVRPGMKAHNGQAGHTLAPRLATVTSNPAQGHQSAFYRGNTTALRKVEPVRLKSFAGQIAPWQTCVRKTQLRRLNIQALGEQGLNTWHER